MDRRRLLASILFASLASAPAFAQSGCPAPIALVDTSRPNAVVGNGMPASCTDAALAGGGVVVFDCGASPVTIPVTSTKAITKDTVIDGGGLVTLDGGGTVRILSVPSVFTFKSPTLTVQRLAFTRGNSAGVAGDDTARGGGAIWCNGGNVHVIDCTFVDNHGPSAGQDVAGGAIYDIGLGEVTVVDSAFSANSASNGGAIAVLHAGLTLVDTTVSHNAATGTGGNPGNGGNGGGIYSDGVDQVESLCGVTIEENQANAFGGGFFRVSNDGNGPMSIDRTSVLSNAIPDHAPGQPSMAGGLYLQGLQIQLTSSTIAWNQASFIGGLFLGPQSTTIAMTNVTVAENTALSSLAGGIAIDSVVTGSIVNSTIARNAAPGSVAFGGGTVGGSQVLLRNTIVDGNSVGNGYNPISCQTTFLEGGGNLQWPIARAGGGSDSPGSLCSASVTLESAALGPLDDHGGGLLTILPSASSPAVGMGESCPETDARGVARPADHCTAGAVELAPEAPAVWLQVAALSAVLGLGARWSLSARA
jgi:hypothetical protein